MSRRRPAAHLRGADAPHAASPPTHRPDLRGANATPRGQSSDTPGLISTVRLHHTPLAVRYRSGAGQSLPLASRERQGITPRYLILPMELAAGSTGSLCPPPQRRTRAHADPEPPRPPGYHGREYLRQGCGGKWFPDGQTSRALVGGPGPPRPGGHADEYPRVPRTRAVLGRPDRACALTVCFT